MKQPILDFLNAAATWLTSQINNIVSGVIASVIIIAFGEIYGFGHLTLKKYQVRKLWRFRRPMEVRVVSGSIDQSDPFVRAPTSWPDANAASILIQCCKYIYPKTRVTHSFHSAPDELIGDIIAVGGPAHNDATRELLACVSSRITFSQIHSSDSADRYALVVSDKTYMPEFDGTRVRKDFGAIVRMRNPLNYRNSDSILVIGCETFGVLAAALVLIHDNVASSARAELAKMLPWARSHVDFIAVFSCQPLQYSVGAIRFEDFYRIDLAIDQGGSSRNHDKLKRQSH